MALLEGPNEMKIAFIHNRYIAYRLLFFRKLAKMFNILLFFDRVHPKITITDEDFNYKILKSIPILKSYHVTLSPTLFFHLLKGKYHLFIGAGIGHLGTSTAFLISRLTHKPFILWSAVWDRPRTILRALTWPFTSFMIRRSNAIVVPGSKSKEFMLSIGVESDRVFIAPNVSNVTLVKTIRKEKLKKKLGMKSKKIVLYLGRLVESKGLFHLIEAFSKLQREISDSFLLIAGEGEIGKDLKQLCLSLKINNIRFTDCFIGEKEKPLYYSLADVFVLPSIFAKLGAEVWGLVINEAMSVAKPVISTTAVGGAYDLIKNDINGYMVEAGDAQALYEALRKLLTNPVKAKKMGIESKKIIEKSFTIDDVMKGFVRAIEYVMS